jgi:hypothetical protein
MRPFQAPGKKRAREVCELNCSLADDKRIQHLAHQRDAAQMEHRVG